MKDKIKSLCLLQKLFQIHNFLDLFQFRLNLHSLLMSANICIFNDKKCFLFKETFKLTSKLIEDHYVELVVNLLE